MLFYFCIELLHVMLILFTMLLDESGAGTAVFKVCSKAKVSQ